MIDAVDAGDVAEALGDPPPAAARRCAAIMTRTQGAIMAKAALQLLGLIPSGADARCRCVDATDERGRALLRDRPRRGGP